MSLNIRSFKWKNISLVGLGAIIGIVLSVQFSALAQKDSTSLPLEELRLLADVFGLIKSDYVEPVDDRKLLKEAVSGMVASLDPHSAYLDEKAFKELREGTEGRFVGLGIEVGMEDGYVKIISPIEGSPAFRAGLKPSDLITRLDTTPVKGLSLDEAVKRMRGEPGTQITLTVVRKNEDRPLIIKIVREEIHVQSVKTKMIEPGYAWIRISQFQEPTLEDFSKRLEMLFKQEPDMKGLVLDLRNDPGGLLPVAVGIAAAFLPSDAVVVSTKGQLKESQMTLYAKREDYALRRYSDPLRKLPAATRTVPLIVLVNAGSASASEIVAGALQDHKRALILGTQTFGKGSVQTVRQISENTAIKLTTARYYTPNDRSIQAKGITPDYYVEETAEGSAFDNLRLREADLEKHLRSDKEAKDNPANHRDELEAAQRAADLEKKRKPVEFGGAEDFQLSQALNYLKGLPVKVSKKPEEVSEPSIDAKPKK